MNHDRFLITNLTSEKVRAQPLRTVHFVSRYLYAIPQYKFYGIGRCNEYNIPAHLSHESVHVEGRLGRLADHPLHARVPAHLQG